MQASRRTATLAELGEFGFIGKLARLLGARPGVELGIGDDCAIVRVGSSRLLLTTDALIENVHFRRDWQTYRDLGRRSFAVNGSDIAAMGGRPLFALLAIAAPPAERAGDLLELHRGFESEARSVGATLVGGNMSSSRELVIAVALIGRAPRRPLRRDRARVGDLVCVSGSLGGAALARERRAQARGRRGRTITLPVPRARVGLGRRLAEDGLARAAIDVSDGLLQDLGHLCRASGVGAEIDLAALPLATDLRRLPPSRSLELALRGGEDYELLFTAPPARRAVLERFRRPGVTVIGRIVSGRSVTLIDAGRRMRAAAKGGFDHFART